MRIGFGYFDFGYELNLVTTWERLTRIKDNPWVCKNQRIPRLDLFNDCDGINS